jgi:histidinol-phosphatase (PHP family)
MSNQSQWPYSIHLHTPYSDGATPAAHVAEAAARSHLSVLGFSEHAPLGDDVTWTLPAGRVEEYRAEVSHLRNRYAGSMEILCGLECDWWQGRPDAQAGIQRPDWDYLIGSVHFVGQDPGAWAVDESPEVFARGVQSVFGSIRDACDAFFAAEREAALSGRYDVLGHYDLVKKYNKGGCFFDATATWYRDMAVSVVEAAARSGIIVEVNTAGLDKPVGECYPAPWLVERCVARGVRLTLTSDAHSAGEVQRHYSRALADLRQIGVRQLWAPIGGAWTAIAL